MMNLVIDIGNSAAKAALFNGREIVRAKTFSAATPAGIKSFLGADAIGSSIFSSVGQPAAELEHYLESLPGAIRFQTGLKSAVRIKYKTPETLGPDRLAAVIGAVSLYPGKNILVIDAGTCITFDFVDQDLNYYGGSISPGLNMRFNALHQFTGKLPLIARDEEFNRIYGDDTRSAILTGVQQGIQYELNGQINAFMKDYPDLLVVICGGDAAFFESRLKFSIFAPIVKTEPYLVLNGLNEVIFQHND